MREFPDQQIDSESQTTGLPGLRSWRTVYALVSIVLFCYILLLAALTRNYQ